MTYKYTVTNMGKNVLNKSINKSRVINWGHLNGDIK